MARVDRSILQANDQNMGDFGDPNKLESSISYLADTIDGIDNDTSTLKTDNTSNKSRLTALEGDVSILETDNTDNKSKITVLEGDNANNKNRLTTLETDNTSNKSRISTNESNIAYNEGRLVELLRNEQKASEVVDARMGFPVLRDKLESVDVQLADVAINIENYPVQIPEVDDTARLKRLLANAQNKNVILKSGQNYNISDTLYPPKGCKIFGYNATITNNITTSIPVFWIEKSNSSIFDITIQNTELNVGIDNAVKQSLYGSGVAVGYPSNTLTISNIVLENVTVKRGIDGVSGIIFMGDVENCSVKRCLVDGEGAAAGTGFVASFHVEWNGVTVFSPRNIAFEDCIAINNTKTGSYAYYMSGAYGLNLKRCVANNVVHGALFYDGDKGVQTGKELINSLEDSHIINFTGYGVSIRGTDNANVIQRYTGVKIDNNFIKGLNNGSTASTNGIRIYRNGGGITIMNNKIKTVNVGINTDPCKGVLIDHNEFDDIYNQAIYTVKMEKSFITKNTFKDVSKSANAVATDSAIVLTFLSNDNLIKDNIFGYDGQSVLPRFHIFIKNETTTSNNPINNKIHENTFFATAGGYSIINGITSGNFTHVNYVSGNVIVGTDNISSGSCIYEVQGNKKVAYHVVAPTVGTWKVGDTVYNISPSAGGYLGWICTAAGTPGTWKGFGLIQV